MKSVSQSVVKQIGAAPIFTRCGRATLTPVLEYLVTEPPLKSDGTPRYAAPAAKVMLSMRPQVVYECMNIIPDASQDTNKSAPACNGGHDVFSGSPCCYSHGRAH
jgi:hypothetical protein